jgi:DNA-directed RNA polymerase subunit RPC12/RpoP
MKMKLIFGTVVFAMIVTSNIYGQSTTTTKSDSMKMEMNQKDHDHNMEAMKDKYTCSMHPEIVSDQPGDCSKCGMKLVKTEETTKMYTCSMHPEIMMDNPGDCPKCGMKLIEKSMDKKSEKMDMKEHNHKH